MSTGKFKSSVRSCAYLSLFLLILGAVSFAFSDVVFSFGQEIGLTAKIVSAESTPENLIKSPTEPFSPGVRQLVTIEFNIAAGNPPSANLSFGNSPVLPEVVDGTAATLSTLYSSRTNSLLLPPTAATVSVSGLLLSSEGSPLIRASVRIMDSNGNARTASTNSFGKFRIDQIPSGQIYTIGVSAKGYEFNPQVININVSISDLVLEANPR